jgi:hypothetical protein
MPPKRNFDAALATLEALREASPEAAEPELAKALNLRNNFLVAKGAAVTLHHRLTGLTPNLAAAFPRFLESSAKSDPSARPRTLSPRPLPRLNTRIQNSF